MASEYLILQELKAFFLNHPTVLLLIAFIIYRIYRLLYPIPFPKEVKGSKVKTLKTLKQFDVLFDASLQSTEKDGGESKAEENKKEQQEMKRRLIVVDSLQRLRKVVSSIAAAPVYGEMSKEYDESNVAFFKVNVDEAREIASAHKITAMPTFKIFESTTKKELKSIRGWSESALRSAIVDFQKAKAE